MYGKCTTNPHGGYIGKICHLDVGSYINAPPMHHLCTWPVHWYLVYKITSQIGPYIDVPVMHHLWSWLVHWYLVYKIASQVGPYINAPPMYRL